MLAKETVENRRRLLASLTRLANLMLNGGVPKFACPALYGASLCALTKKDGGIRPIAVGSVLRRVTAKIAAKHATGLLASQFTPRQLGVGTPGGCEAIIHAAREFIKFSSELNSPQIFIKVDVSNAFNSIDRPAFLSEIAQNCPQIFPLMRQAYGFSSPIFYGKTKLLSETGLHQDDPLASLAFSLAINPIIGAISSPFNAWYLDDGAFGGGLEQTLDDLGMLGRALLQIGLKLNQSKCEIPILSSPTTIAYNSTLARVRQKMPNITETLSNRLTLLGAPLGVAGLNSSLSKCSRKVELICDRVQTLDSHWALFFLTRYASAPRLNHMLRSSPAYLQPDILDTIDALISDTLVKCINVQLPGNTWSQATLPLRFGGLGVRSVADLALPCYISSINSSLELVHKIYTAVGEATVPESLLSAVAEFQARFPYCEMPDGEAVMRQRAWDDISCTTRFSDLIAPANQVHRARLLAAKEPHSGAWLKTVPLPNLGLHLDDATIRVAVALRVGATICEPQNCRCGRLVDRLGHHGLSPVGTVLAAFPVTLTSMTW